ncbi:hypothetical protein V6N12_075617 [Hibiscus sabdariffa]|uniref:Uncharacterized protein n=1 Tax=Hibiscus sabdariffa TaxID=183260 RepID=A0ABR2C838_9ROSI
MGGKQGEIAAERERREFLEEKAGVGVGGEACLERFEGFAEGGVGGPDDVGRVREWDGESGKWLGLVVVVAEEE